MLVFNKGRDNEVTVRVVLESEEHGREYFDEYDTVEECGAAVIRLANNALRLDDGVSRQISVVIVPKSEYGDESGYGFDLGSEEEDDDEHFVDDDEDDDEQEEFDLTLCTTSVTPAYVTRVSVKAADRAEAVRKAFALDFNEFEWTDAAGNVTPWGEMGSSDVTVAD